MLTCFELFFWKLFETLLNWHFGAIESSPQFLRYLKIEAKVNFLGGLISPLLDGFPKDVYTNLVGLLQDFIGQQEHNILFLLVVLYFDMMLIGGKHSVGVLDEQVFVLDFIGL